MSSKRTIDHEWNAYATTVVTAAVALLTRAHPLWLLAIAGTLGASGLI